ncbi:beta-class phenol-soluble modulin [Staphylococcus xylosus]|nr:beta-class phenol-soluble modulin [Staphylococcus xylosus]PTI53979.1 phenol soluble modulin [Staphylococcus xylosus]PTI56827.1 phenol soluble modulin [Staphylococcus xylosus]
MAGLFDAIKETVQAGIAGDGAKLGTSIVENGVGLVSKLFGF